MPNSALYVAANIQPVFHLRLAAGYRGIGRLLALPRSHPVSQCFWSWVLADPADPIYKATSSSFALERDALGHLYPEIVEDPNLRFDYEIDEAAFASNRFADIGQSSRFIKRFTQDSPLHSAIQIWTDGLFRSQDLNCGTAYLIWTQGYDVPPRTDRGRIYGVLIDAGRNDRPDLRLRVHFSPGHRIPSPSLLRQSEGAFLPYDRVLEGLSLRYQATSPSCTRPRLSGCHNRADPRPWTQGNLAKRTSGQSRQASNSFPRRH